MGVAGLRPRPLMRVESDPSLHRVTLAMMSPRHRSAEDAGRTHGKRGPTLAAVWYQSDKVITVESVGRSDGMNTGSWRQC